MYEDFWIENGWIGKKYEDKYFFLNIRDKQFAVFQSEKEYLLLRKQILTDVLVRPTPDFIEPPRFAALTLTTKCNMNCPYCFVKPVKCDGELTPEKTAAAVRALAEQKDRELVLFAWGGEPTQNPAALISMLETALQYQKLKVLLISNGVIEEKLLKKLLTYKNLVFQISFDGTESESIQKPLASKQESLTRMLSSMKTIHEVSERVSFRTTVTKRNVSELHKCLIPTAKQYTNRIMLEHLHTYNGRAVLMKKEAPSVKDYTDLVFDIVPKAEAQGLHVRVIPFDQIRESGNIDNMNFINVLDDGNITLSNAVIHHTHEDFPEVCIGKIEDESIKYDEKKNNILTERFLGHYSQQCQNCFVRPICRGRLQRYLFITKKDLGEWDDHRCQYYRSIIARWFDITVNSLSEYMKHKNLESGWVNLIPPDGKVQYPVFVMEGGFTLSASPFPEV